MAKILIVEDEKQMTDFINLELKHEGYEVDICYNGEQGIDK
jgi:two-component system response regulator ArlR